MLDTVIQNNPSYLAYFERGMAHKDMGNNGLAIADLTITLVLAIFLLRHAGQGLMSHIAITTMARYFHARRGKAIAIATLGYSAGEALLPFLAVLAIGIFGWRWTYGGVVLLFQY